MNNIFKNINSINIYISIIPLLVPSFSLINAIITLLSLSVIHLLVVMCENYVYKYFKDKTFYNYFSLGQPIIIIGLLGTISALAFKNISVLVINLIPYITASEMLLILLFKCNFNNLKESLKNNGLIILKIAVFLLIISFLRELIGLVSIFDIKLPVGNFEGISFFRHTAGGILLLGVLAAVYPLLFNNKTNY